MAVTDCENAVRYPFRFGPALDLVKLKNLMANIFGKKEGESPFRSCDAALIFDGRSRKYDREVMKHLKAHIKFVAKENLPARKYEVFRMHYHNSSRPCITSKPLCANTPVTSVALCLFLCFEENLWMAALCERELPLQICSVLITWSPGSASWARTSNRTFR